MPPPERKPRNLRSESMRRNIPLVACTILVLAGAVNLWRSWRILAIALLVLLPIAWILNLTVFSANRPLPRDTVPKYPFGLGS
jgi:hypothetical protein